MFIQILLLTLIPSINSKRISRHCNLDRLDEDNDLKLKSNRIGKVVYEHMIIDVKFFVIHDDNRGKLKEKQIQG